MTQPKTQGNVVVTPDVFPPLVVAGPDAVAWDAQADVVIAGFGAAGASAALELHERAPDADILILDRHDGGGASAVSGGIFYAGGTRHQREAGYEDTAEEMYKYLRMEVGDAVSDATLRHFCETSNDNLLWLEKHGVRFSGAVFEEKTAYPPGDKFLYYSGNEKVAKYKAQAIPAPRGHRVVGKGFSGYALFAALSAAVDRAGIRVQRQSPVRRLVVDEMGRVLGVEIVAVPQALQTKRRALYDRFVAMRPFQNRRVERAVAEMQLIDNDLRDRKLIRARHGVVLAAGGFISSVPMLKQFTHSNIADNYHALVRCGTAGCLGAGIRLGLSVGAATGKMGNVMLGRTIAPPTGPLEGIIVNRAGRRFISEDSYIGFLGEAIGRQSDGDAWLILDRAGLRKILRQLIPNGDGNFLMLKLPLLSNLLFGGTRRAPTLDALARKCGIDAAGLRDEIAAYNAAARSGKIDPDPLGKVADYVRAIEGGPYYALNMALANPFAYTVALTLGGLAVDESSGAALREDSGVIDGLYAVGRSAVGICSNAYFSGMGLADCVYSGRRTGAALAAQCRTGETPRLAAA